MQRVWFWWRLVRWPSVTFTVLVALFALTQADVVIASALFYDDAHSQWIGASSWWINAVMHTGGRWFIRTVVAFACCVLLASCIDPALRALRRPAGYFVLATVLSIGLIGLLKEITNVDCPWDLIAFGGKFPVVSLFADRPDALRAGQCFPAAHAGSGYALVVLYFLFRERRPDLARYGLAIGIVIGLLFGIAQQSRGAHFVSHDVWSAFICWIVAASMYVYAFGSCLYGERRREVRDETIGSVRAPVPAYVDAAASRHRS